MSVLSVLCYSEKMFRAAIGSRVCEKRPYVKKPADQKEFTGGTDPCAPEERAATSSPKITSPVVHVSITAGF